MVGGGAAEDFEEDEAGEMRTLELVGGGMINWKALQNVFAEVAFSVVWAVAAWYVLHIGSFRVRTSVPGATGNKRFTLMCTVYTFDEESMK